MIIVPRRGRKIMNVCAGFLALQRFRSLYRQKTTAPISPASVDSSGDHTTSTESDPNGTYLSRNAGWVSAFCVTHRALRRNTTDLFDGCLPARLGGSPHTQRAGPTLHRLGIAYQVHIVINSHGSTWKTQQLSGTIPCFSVCFRGHLFFYNDAIP